MDEVNSDMENNWTLSLKLGKNIGLLFPDCSLLQNNCNYSLFFFLFSFLLLSSSIVKHAILLNSRENQISPAPHFILTLISFKI